ncbi:hypothetical protein DENSPDRAFT_854308 [Dentipellis sp. KUC8613]|nr:hypothetical protein DENSPDRAFT_854308 [Dentipellis sp. KUC8613]
MDIINPDGVLDLHLSWSPIGALLQAMMDAPMPRLQHLDVQRRNTRFPLTTCFLPSSSTAWARPLPLGAEGGAPAFKSLSLLGKHVDWSACTVSRLERLKLGFLSNEFKPKASELLNLLDNSKNTLEVVSLYGVLVLEEFEWENAPEAAGAEENDAQATNTATDAPGQPVEEDECAASILKLFRYPKMQKLTMRDMEYDFSDDDSGRILGSDASCVMRTLTAQNSLPAVNFLVLQEMNGCSSGFLQALATAPPVAFESSEPGPTSALPTILCPSLRNLTIIDMEYRKVVRMLRTRKAAGEKAHVPKFDYLSVVWDMHPFVVDVGFPSRLLAYSIDVHYVDVREADPQNINIAQRGLRGKTTRCRWASSKS